MNGTDKQRGFWKIAGSGDMQIAFSRGSLLRYIPIAAILACYLIILVTAFGVAPITLLKFVLFTIVSIILPGLAVWQFLNFRKPLSLVASACAIYAIGYVLLIVQYFISVVVGSVVSFRAVAIVFSILSVAAIAYKVKRCEFKIWCAEETSGEWIGIVAFALFLGLSTFSYSANYLSPEISGMFSANRDIVYWGNNTAALKIAFPPNNLFFADSPLNYHYFSNIPLSFISSVWNIDIFTLSFPLYSLTPACIMVGACLTLMEVIGARGLMKAFGMIALLFMTGFENASLITRLHHTLLAPFGCDLSLGYGLLFLSALIAQWNRERFSGPIFSIAALFWFMCIGCKGPVAVVFMIVPGILCVYALFKHNFAFAFGYGIPILLVFFFVSKYCLGLFNVVSNDDATLWRLSLYGADNIAASIAGTGAVWGNLSLLAQSNIVIAVLIKFLVAGPAIFCGAIVSLAVFVILLRKSKLPACGISMYIALSVAALIGMVMWMMVDAGGKSEMYFAMAAQCIECAAIIYIFQTFIGAKLELTTTQKRWEVSAGLILTALVVVGCFCYMFYGYNGNGAMTNSYRGIANLAKATSSSQSENSSSVSKGELQGLAWIRDNTPLDAVVLSDKAVVNDDPAFYCYGLFSERQQYIEGTNMLAQSQAMKQEIDYRKSLVLDAYGNDMAAIDVLRSQGVGYIVQTKSVTPAFDGQACGLDRVFENDEMAVYEL